MVREKAEQRLRMIIMGPPQFETTVCNGDRIETHQIWCATADAEKVHFSHAKQVFAIRRIVEPKGKTAKASDTTSYGITSLPVYGSDKQNAQSILSIRRRHWSIESKSHNSRDKTYQEDSCQVRNHNAARVLVAFRQLAIFLCANKAHNPREVRGFFVPEFNRFCSFMRDDALKWLTKASSLSF
ncbi:MAG TPA: hypothetical protein PLK94_12145 [Alphaproteobacteria bacterium]|nr:hypothetical protein [Alphaproteobacteria bacterium]